MNRIDARFAQLKRQGRRALVPYVCAGHPSDSATVPVMHALVDSGADLLELGVPFSDPMADGPVIQRASEKALTAGVGLRRVLELVELFRQEDQDTPVILMGYLNPVHRMGLEAFCHAAAAAGVDGVLLVDAPPEESAEIESLLDSCGLHQIFLVAPTTSEERMDLVVKRARGFVYYVALKGVTGAGNLSTDDVAKALIQLRNHTDLPVGVGFGIKNAEDACRIGEAADAVVIGSALVSSLDGADDDSDARRRAAAFLQPIRDALDGMNRDTSVGA